MILLNEYSRTRMKWIETHPSVLNFEVDNSQCHACDASVPALHWGRGRLARSSLGPRASRPLSTGTAGVSPALHWDRGHLARSSLGPRASRPLFTGTAGVSPALHWGRGHLARSSLGPRASRPLFTGAAGISPALHWDRGRLARSSLGPRASRPLSSNVTLSELKGSAARLKHQFITTNLNHSCA
jgi:hypothetical protein